MATSRQNATPTETLARHRVQVIAHYFPQFHEIPENNEWWGRGFTDWTNVRKAKPLFAGHYQPRIPLDQRYYDQSRYETLAWQIDVAKRYGIGGFCHYHYWFEGKQLLTAPTDLVMQHKSLNLPYCLAWANETWSRRWDGRERLILQEQTHRPDPTMWTQHFEYLFRAWSDERAIKVDGKPIFLIYRPHFIERVGDMLDHWRELAVKRGLSGVYFIAMKQFEFPVPEAIKHFDAIAQFQPFEAIYSPDYHGRKGMEQRKLLQPLRKLPEPMLRIMREVRDRFMPRRTHYDYDGVWQHILKPERELGLPAFPGAFIDWDNTARYGKRARLFDGASPEKFASYFRTLVEITANRPAPEHFIFINAWNEWAESTYLEPDAKHGHKHLEAVREALAAISSSI
jgi:lipopolysaccharide biosynthesis protein